MSDQVQVEAEHYRSWAYNTKERLCSFWHQVDEVHRLGAASVLEVGLGAGVVATWLRDRGIAVTTVDIDEALAPDLVGSVTALPCDDAAFDAALCCEVLEHLPFDDVVPALRELRRVARRAVIISVPDDRPWLGKGYPLYFGMYADELRRRYPIRRAMLAAVLRRRLRLRDAAFIGLVPERWSRGGPIAEARRPPIPHVPWSHAFDGEHYWEVGTAECPVERLEEAFAEASLRPVRDFRVPENPGHHFWVLEAA